MSVRALAGLATLAVAALALGLVAEDPGLLNAAAAKLGEGGMWTALAVFLAAALVLGLRRGPGR